MLPADATPERMIERAETWLDEAEEMLLGEDDGGEELAMKAQRLRTRAAKAMSPGPELLRLLLGLLFTADNLDDRRRMVWAVRGAVLCNPNPEQEEELRDYWESCSWLIRGDRSFPTPPTEGERPRRPLPGQMSFLEDAPNQE